MQQQPLHHNGQIMRAEYEARHAALTAQLAQLEARIELSQSAIKTDVERKFDRLIDMLDDVRDKVVAKDVLTPQLETLQMRLKAVEQEQISRMERFWMRFGPLIALGMFILTLLEVAHIHIP